MSEHLKAFLSAWIDWVDAGAPNDDGRFKRWHGLCSNFSTFLFGACETYEEIDREREHLAAAFVVDGLNEEYPFGGEDRYFEEIESETTHLNEQRIQWVRSKVAQQQESDLGRAVREVRGGDAPTPKRAFA